MEEQVTGVEGVGEAGSQTQGSEQTNTGVEPGSEAGATPNKDEETAWAKRIAAVKEKAVAEERAKWEKETSERYKDYDVYKEVAEYLRESSGFDDILSAKEAIELERLQAQAETQQVPVEVLKRIQELEAKAAKAEVYEKQQEEQKVYQEFRSQLDKFAQEKGIDADEFHKFMYENEVSNFEIAYKAFKFEDVETKRQEIEKEAVKKFLEAKGSIPKVEGGSRVTGQVLPGTPKSFNDAQARAMARLNSLDKMEG